MVKFRWYGNPITVEGRDVPIALEEFLRLIEGVNRVNNKYVRSMARSEFKRRIELASAGRLKPITQIKPVDILNPPPLYEIRWQGITVMERGSDGVVADLDLLIRMYHSEPAEAPNHFIGHNMHEKVVHGVESVWEAQDREIDIAKNYFKYGLSTLWGISDLT